MAFAQTVLAWGAISFPAGFELAGQTEYLRENLMWGAEYLMATHTGPNELLAQVEWHKSIKLKSFWNRTIN